MRRCDASSPAARAQVVQPFDGAKFNFTKALQKEVLFQFEEAAAPGGAAGYAPLSPVTGSPNLVFINVSPIEYGHVLLVPRALDRLPQLAGPASVRLALQFAAEAGNPYFRLAFNSLGAYGTINHLHFQARQCCLFPMLYHALAMLLHPSLSRLPTACSTVACSAD
jgi:GDP-L-galactose phosphorylase